MEYRNSGNATHHGTGLVTNVTGDAGVEMVGSTITVASDSAAAHLTIKGKGTGGVILGNSTSVVSGIGRGVASTPLVAIPASALVYSTITIPGVAVGDVLLMSRSAGMSTALGLVGSWVTATDEGTYAVINNLASTQSIQSTSTFPYMFVKA
jgi:hypothetical protein